MAVVLRLLLAGLTTFIWAPARAAEVRVAVAANFTAPAEAIATAFEAKTGHAVKLSFGSSGQFYAQIVREAPFDVFLSADADRPTRLEKEGRAVAGTRFTYATGRLVLWSRTARLVDRRGLVLARGRFSRLAVADPQTAPYGAAAIQTLQRLGLYQNLSSRLVTGTSISQAHQFVRSGAADLGFVALSQVAHDRSGSRWLVPGSLHDPIDQQAVLLKRAAENSGAAAFLRYLRTAEAKALIRRYGYEVADG